MKQDNESKRLHTALVYRLLELCKERDIGISQLAIKAQLPLTTVKNILSGASISPGLTTLSKLCKGFGISLSEFFDSPYFK